MASSTAQLVTRNVSSIIQQQQQQHGHTTDSYHPSIAVVIGVLSTMFSVTFLILLYAKHCTRPPPNDVNEDANLQRIMSASDIIQYPPHPPALTDHPLFIDRVDSGLDRTLVNALPSFPFSSLRGQKDGLECAVCLTRFVHTDILRLLPVCRHVFHLHCLDVWLSLHATCPLCRQRVDILDATPATTCLALQEFLDGSPNSSFRHASLDQHGPILDRGAFEFYVQREPDLPIPTQLGTSARFNGASASTSARFNGASARFSGSSRFNGASARFNGASARFNGSSARFIGSSARIGNSARFSGIFGSARRKDNQASSSSSTSVLQNENQKINGSSVLNSENQRFNGSSRRLELPLNIIDRKGINGSSRFHNFIHHETIDEAENSIPCSIQETEDQQNESNRTGDQQDDTKIDMDEISTNKKSIDSNAELSIELFPHLYNLDEHLLQRLNHRIVISDMASCHHRWSDFLPSDVPYFDATTVDLRPRACFSKEDKKEENGENEKNGEDLGKKNVAKVGKGFGGGSARLCSTKVADVESAYKVVSGQRRCMSEMSSVQRTPSLAQQHFVPRSNGPQWFRSLRMLIQGGASRSNNNDSNSMDPSTSTHQNKPLSSPSEDS